MAEQDSFQDKTEAPTPRKRQNAKEEGNIPRSQEVTTAFLLLAAALTIQVGSGTIAGGVRSIFLQVAMTMDNLPVTIDGMSTKLNVVPSRSLRRP